MATRTCRRSNVVGESSPTSTPRWPSRHRTTSGKRERPGLAAGQARRRAPHRLLREAVPERGAPAAEGWPHAGTRRGHGPRTDVAAHLADRLPDDTPEHEGERDSGVAVVPARTDASRDDGQHSPTQRAAVAATSQRDDRRRAVRSSRTAQLSLADAVTVKAKTPARLTTCGSAPACGRTRSIGARRCRQPVLDVEGVMDDL